MTQGEKDLVLKDLSARLPYNVFCEISDVGEPYKLETIRFNGEYFLFNNGVFEKYITEIKPYLRPMSSMTEEESLYILLCNAFIETRSIELKVDFYNERHIDYRDLIGKGLALEAPKDMYKL